ncbi:MAG: HK97 family phage prohead protease [Clostridiales bacterium]|nr:HK97 family phage prohead protease [Clostridiales bacterium]
MKIPIRSVSEQNPEIIKRLLPSNVQALTLRSDDMEGVIDGYPIVFNQRTAIGKWFFEEIDSHALDNADLSDIKLLANHNDMMIPVARHRRGKRSTMDINVDDVGLHINAKLDIANNATARELCSAVMRGDIEDMSFVFGIEVSGDEWFDLDKPMPIRRITKISRVFEVSAVNDGAYPQTSINARSATLDNDKKTLDNVLAEALENEKRAEERAKALILAKQKFLLKERYKNYDNQRTIGKKK